jgi:hypothetical protein
MIIGHFYYFIGLLIFLTNINFIYEIFNFLRIREWLISYQKITNRNPSDKDFRKGDLQKYKKLGGVVNLNLLWLFFGLLSASWKIFMIILLFSYLLDFLIYMIGQFKNLSKLIFLLKIVTITILIFILAINHFHLHLDLFRLLLSLL